MLDVGELDALMIIYRVTLSKTPYSLETVIDSACSFHTTQHISKRHLAHPQQTVKYPNYHDDILKEEVTIVGLKVVLQPKHFRFKSLLLVCRAQIFNIYENSTEKHVELDGASNQIPFDDDIYPYPYPRPAGSSPFQDLDPDIKMNHIKEINRFKI
uniref:Uncharacterized protein n=1 Tax=Megaselia scalaris TaxID=36166 RepID=T1GRU1_MEGSC